MIFTMGNEMEPSLTSAQTSEPDVIGLPHGVALNCVEFRCPGTHLVTKFEKPRRPEKLERRVEKKALEEQIGQSVFVGDSFAYVPGHIDSPGGSRVEVACDIDRWQLHLFDLRAALAAQAQARGYEAWFGFGGELHIGGLPGEKQVGEIVVTQQLRIRVVREDSEEADDSETRIVVRPRTRWLLAGSLADQRHRDDLIGESAERLSGDGLRCGRIIAFDSDSVILRVSDDEKAPYPLSDYTVAAHSHLVWSRYGAKVFQSLQIASGALTDRGVVNRYAVRDRFQAASRGLAAAIGRTVEMPGGRHAEIDGVWTEVRVQEER